MDIEDFLRFIPNDSIERGMAGLLWKRYLIDFSKFNNN